MLQVLFFITVIAFAAVLLYLIHFSFFNQANWKIKAEKLQKLLDEESKRSGEDRRKLKQKAYQAEVLRELSERIGYSLNIPKIIEVITGSLGEVLDYNTASYLITEDDRLKFHCFVSQSVNHNFIKDVRRQMVKAFSTMLDSEISSKYIEETISGTILDDTLATGLDSFFNLPLVIGGKIVGLINVASSKKGLYAGDETRILYTITEQAADHYTRLKKILQEEKRRLNSMVASMADGVIMLNKDIQPIVFNPAAISMLSLRKKDGLTILDIANALSGKIDLRTKIDESLENDTVVEQKDIYLQNKALHLLISPVKDAKGELLGTAVLFRDVTAEKELEQMREEFTAMMVHELRAPLTTIKGTTDMIVNEERLPLNTKNKLLITMKKEAEHMLEMVGDLLDVAKIEAGKFQIEPHLNNIAQTVQETMDKFKPQAEQKGLSLRLSAQKNIPKINIDKLRIGQVLNNLLSNAIKYTDKGAIITNLSLKDNFVIISVSDTGSGMDTNELAGLFSKFKQFGKGKSGAIKGTGLGLVIAKGIVESHGGKIWAESDGRNKGSKFSFSVPIKNIGESGKTGKKKGGDS